MAVKKRNKNSILKIFQSFLETIYLKHRIIEISSDTIVNIFK